MAIKHVVTAGYGFADGVKFIPTRGFTPAGVVVPSIPGQEFTLPRSRARFTLTEERQRFTLPRERGRYTINDGEK